MNRMAKIGKLYIVATPIGNLEDITVRALKVLGSVDAVICEERRAGSTLLKRLGVNFKELLPLNEHNEPVEAANIALRMANGESFALISDTGTPVFADPGAELIRQVVEYGVETVPIPGPSSLTAALSVLDFKLERYVFAGFLSRAPEIRHKELQHLRALRMPVVLLDTPYRLNALLEAVSKVFGANQRVTLAFDLTLPGEMICRGTVEEVRHRIGARKGEFVLIIHAE